MHHQKDSNMRDFLEWYETYLTEAEPRGDVTGASRWHYLKGFLPSIITGEKKSLEQRGKEREAYLKRDDPDEMKRKQDIMELALERAFLDAAPGASSATQLEIKNAAKFIANAYTHGGRLGPSHIHPMLVAVHADTGIDQKNKDMYWADHVTFFSRVIDPAVDSVPDAFYIPHDSRNINHPNFQMEKNKFRDAATQFAQSSEKSKPTAATPGKVNMWAWVQNTIPKDTMTFNDLRKTVENYARSLPPTGKEADYGDMLTFWNNLASWASDTSGSSGSGGP